MKTKTTKLQLIRTMCIKPDIHMAYPDLLDACRWAYDKARQASPRNVGKNENGLPWFIWGNYGKWFRFTIGDGKVEITPEAPPLDLKIELAITSNEIPRQLAAMKAHD